MSNILELIRQKQAEAEAETETKGKERKKKIEQARKELLGLGLSQDVVNLLLND